MSTNNSDFPKGLELILKDMCDAVNVNYEDIDFKEEEWYFKHEWTMKEEQAFINQQIDKISSNKQDYTGVFRGPIPRSKKGLEKALQMFTLQYGWKYKEETK